MNINDPIVNFPTMGSLAMSEVDMNTLTVDDINAIIRQAPTDANLMRYLLDKPDTNPDILNRLMKGSTGAINQSNTARSRAKAGQGVTRQEAMNTWRMLNSASRKSGLSGVFFTSAKKIKNLKVTSTEGEFFVKTLKGSVQYEIIKDDVIIAYNTSSRKGKKNPDILKHLSRFNLEYMDEIGSSAIIYSLGRDITLDTLAIL